jgi:hypothetical protein
MTRQRPTGDDIPPVRPVDEFTRPLTFWETAVGTVALLTYLATTAALFYAVAWVISWLGRFLR